MEKPATLAQEARSGVIGSAGPENSTGPYNGAQRVLRWRNEGTHTSPHWVAHHGPYKAIVWGYRGAWAWVVYCGSRKVACGPSDRRFARPGLPHAGAGYVRACNARRGCERWLRRQESEG